MPLSLPEFSDRLTSSGLLSADDVRAFIEEAPAEKRPTDGEGLARLLVTQKRLTKYQAEQVYAGKGASVVLGNYVILDKLGQGGMGMVLKAEHKRLKRLVAIKVMSPAAVKTPDALKRFHREVEAAAKLRHPNVVATDDADEAKGIHFLVMEYVEGSDLSVLVKKQGPLSVEKAVSCIVQAARGLEFAHQQGVIHRDIKPANLLVDAKGTVKILDMGLARIEGQTAGQAELTSTGAVMGTVDYMAPEQALSTKHADARSDVYSLGISLWYLLTGKCAYDGDTLMAKLLAHRDAPIPSLIAALQSRPVAPQPDSRTASDAGVSADDRTGAARSESVSRSDSATLAALDLVFRRMVAKQAQDRQQTMTEVIRDLEDCVSGRMSSVSMNLPQTKEDSQFKAFLNNLDAAPGEAQTVTQRPSKSPANAADSAFEATLLGSDLVAPTDPQTLTSAFAQPGRRGPGLEPQVVSAWWQKRGGQVSAGVVTVVLLVASVFLLPARNPTSPAEPAVASKASAPASQGESSSDRNLTTSATKTTGWQGWPADAPPPAIAPFDAERAKQHQRAWAEYLKLPVEYTNSLGMKFVLIPPGEFLMGSTAAEIEDAVKQLEPIDIGWQVCFQSEAPQHKVILTQPIYLGAHEVTQKEYAAVMKSNPAHFAQTGPGKEAVANIDTHNHPVEMVSWNDAAEFCAKLSQQQELKPFYFRAEETITPLDGTGYRLPTEAEWEFACRAGTTTQFWIGDTDEELNRAGWWGANAGKRTHAVGELKANPLGLFDIHGNVMEWVGDWWEPTYYGQFADKPAIDPHGPTSADAIGPQRVLRGGYWTVRSSHSASSRRDRHHSPFRGRQFGFRVSLPVDAVRQAAGSVGKAPMANGGVIDPPQYALDFNYKLEVGNARVELPPILRPFEACTVELNVTTRSVLDKWDNRVVFLSGGGMQLRQKRGNWEWSTHTRTDDTYNRVMVEGSVLARRRMHLAGVSTGKELRLFIDGHLVGKTPLVGDLPVVASGCLLGGLLTNFDAFPPFDGLIDEVRISKGVRYNENFTPAARLEADADTLAVYHFDEGTGDELKDSSGNNHHGKIVGAKWVQSDKPALARTMASSHFALQFDGDDHVDVGGVDWGPLEKYTLEAFATPERRGDKVGLIVWGKNATLALNTSNTSGCWFSSTKYKDDKTPWYVYGNSPAALQKRVHVAGVVNGRQFRLFVDGELVGTSTAGRELEPFLSESLSFGGNFSGAIDGIHISKAARYEALFTPPSHFEKDAATLALYRFGEGTGNFLVDSSGNGHDGTIHGAKWVKFDGSPIPSAPAIGSTPPPAKAPFDAQQARAHQEAWAKHLGTTVETTNSVGAKMIFIPPGEFLMGSSDADVALAMKIADETKLPAADSRRIQEERPQHAVRITKPFRLSAHEVTIGQFAKFVEQAKYRTQAEEFGGNSGTVKPEEVKPETLKSNWRTPGQAVTDDSPVSQVTWNDAVAYCNWLSSQETLESCYQRSGDSWELLAKANGYRLPTEAEWEYACRAGTTTQFSFGDDWREHDKFGWSNTNAGDGPKPVGLLPANPFGLFDMHGNVWEWCHDWYDGKWYEKSPTNDPVGPTKASGRVLNRGGGWYYLPSGSRSAYRINTTPLYRYYDRGFRVALSSVGTTAAVASTEPHVLRLDADFPPRDDAVDRQPCSARHD